MKGVGKIQKVNVYANIPHGGSFYKSRACVSSTTLEEILDSCSLSRVGAKVYVDGSYIKDLSKSLSDLRTGNLIFLTVEYGETDRKRE